MISEATVLVKVDNQKAKLISNLNRVAARKTYALSQYLDRRRASYKCLIICSPDAIGLEGCIESTLQHSGLT